MNKVRIVVAARASTMLAIRPPSGTPTGGIPATGGIMSSSGESRGGAASRTVVELTDSRSAMGTMGDRLGYLRAPREVDEVPMEKKKKKRRIRQGSRGSSGSPVLSPCPSRYARRSPVEERGKMRRSLSRLMPQTKVSSSTGPQRWLDRLAKPASHLPRWYFELCRERGRHICHDVDGRRQEELLQT